MASDSRHVFNSPIFFEACCRACGIDRTVVFFVYRNDMLEAVLPLARGRVWGVKALLAPGSRNNFADKSPLLLAREDTTLIGVLLQAAMKHAGFIYLAEADQLLTSVCENTLNGFSVLASRSPWVNLEEGDLLQYMSSSRRRDFRSKLRRCEADTHFQFFQDEEAKTAFDTVLRLEEKSRKHDRGTAVFHRPAAQRMFRQLLSSASNPIGIGILFLTGEPAAHFLGFAYGKTFALYHTAFDDRYAKLGIGKIAVYKLLQHLREAGFEKADLLRGNTDAKRQFSDRFTDQYDLFLSSDALTLQWLRRTVLARERLRVLKSRFWR